MSEVKNQPRITDDYYGPKLGSIGAAEMAQQKKIDAYREEQRPTRAPVVRERTIFVRPTGGPVPDLSGGYIPETGIEVSAADVYIARRIRDGSLTIDPHARDAAERARAARASQPAPAPEPAPEPVPEPMPEPEPGPESMPAE